MIFGPSDPVLNALSIMAIVLALGSVVFAWWISRPSPAADENDESHLPTQAE